MFKFLNIKLLLLLVLLLFAASFFSVSAVGNTCRTGRDGYCAELAALVSVPGLEFLQYDDSKGLGGFIASLYVFGLGLVGFSALIVLIYSSFLYMTAGDNMNRVNEARKRISGAIFGLVLAFLSWMILRTINPDLVQSLDIKLTPITLKAPPPIPGDRPGIAQPDATFQGRRCNPQVNDCPKGQFCTSLGQGYTCVEPLVLTGCQRNLTKNECDKSPSSCRWDLVAGNFGSCVSRDVAPQVGAPPPSTPPTQPQPKKIITKGQDCIPNDSTVMCETGTTCQRENPNSPLSVRNICR
ncbi:MAG: pilin [bacterium]|nr:pilin [bacterium]